MSADDRSDPLWVVRPLLDAGFDPKHLRSLAEWIQFEAIAADTDERPVSFREIESHMSPAMRVAFREAVRRMREQGAT